MSVANKYVPVANIRLCTVICLRLMVFIMLLINNMSLDACAYMGLVVMEALKYKEGEFCEHSYLHYR